MSIKNLLVQSAEKNWAKIRCDTVTTDLLSAGDITAAGDIDVDGDLNIEGTINMNEGGIFLDKTDFPEGVIDMNGSGETLIGLPLLDPAGTPTPFSIQEWNGVDAYVDRFFLSKSVAGDYWSLIPAYNYEVGATNEALHVDDTGKLGKAPSHRACKMEIEDLIDHNRVYNMKPRKFYYRKRDNEGNYLEETDGVQQSGFVAEEMDEVAEICTSYNKDGQPSGIKFNNIIPYLVKCIQEQKKEIDALKAKIQ
jgi:hypothetical protein